MFKFLAKKNKMMRTDIINGFIQHHGYKSYLEIGVNTPAQPGWSHDSIQVEVKHGVDPAPEVKATFPVPSDEFFTHHVKQKYDIVFVDGLHIFDQAYRDIVNSLKWLNDNGTIVVHDCNPTTEITQRPDRASDVWHGDVWKAILKLRLEHPEIEVYTIDTDEGCGVITKGYQELLPKEKAEAMMYTYEYFDAHRQEILHLISPEEFKKRLG